MSSADLARATSSTSKTATSGASPDASLTSAPVSDRLAVGAVIVNWRGADDTIRCLASMFASSPRPAHLLVVDNASGDDSVARIGGWAVEAGWSVVAIDEGAPLPTPARDLVIVRSQQNRGYAGGANIGARAVLADPSVRYVAILNNDLELAPDYADEVVRAMDQAGAGLASGLIYHRSTSHERIWYAGGGFTPWRALAWHLTERPVGNAPRPTPFVTGCAMVVSRALVERIGLLPEVYQPGYFEDAEFSWRAARAGMPVLLVPKATGWHAVGASFGMHEADPVLFGTIVKHRLWWVRRNVVGPARWGALAYFALSKPIRGLVELLGGRPALGREIVRGWLRGAFADCGDR